MWSGERHNGGENVRRKNVRMTADADDKPVSARVASLVANLIPVSVTFPTCDVDSTPPAF